MNINKLIQKAVLIATGLGIGYYAGLTTSKSGSAYKSTETSHEAAKEAAKTIGRPQNNIKQNGYNPNLLIQPSTNAIGTNAANRPIPRAIDRTEIIGKLEARIVDLKAKGGNEKEIERLENGVANLKKIQERQNEAMKKYEDKKTGTATEANGN